MSAAAREAHATGGSVQPATTREAGGVLMLAVTEDVLSEMVDALVREADPEAVYLFGSRAREDAGAESDVDLLVIEREPFGPRRSRLVELRRLRRALSPFRIAKDILVYSRDEVARWKRSPNHIVAHCLREGRQLYARP